MGNLDSFTAEIKAQKRSMPGHVYLAATLLPHVGPVCRKADSNGGLGHLLILLCGSSLEAGKTRRASAPTLWLAQSPGRQQMWAETEGQGRMAGQHTSCKQGGHWAKKIGNLWNDRKPHILGWYMSWKQRESWEKWKSLVSHCNFCSLCAHYNKISFTDKKFPSCTEALTWTPSSPWEGRAGLKI